MLDSQSLEWLMACERLKDEAVVVERQCEGILQRFAALEREPTLAERDARRHDYLQNRTRLLSLQCEINAIARRLGSHP